jgi:bifunctional DNase/RNase
MKSEDILSKLKKSYSTLVKRNSKKPLRREKIDLRIDQEFDTEYEIAKVDNVGMVDPLALQGVLILKTDEGNEFPIYAFSGEVARYISNFINEKLDALPTIYNMFEQVCEESELFLVKIKIYQSGDALRANLYFSGKKDLVLRNFRASDAIALATFYNAPILIRKDLLKKESVLQ